MFHARDGWYFERLPEGAVHIVFDPSHGKESQPEHEVTLDANAWASVVASVSARNETGETYREALDFHQVPA